MSSAVIIPWNDSPLALLTWQRVSDIDAVVLSDTAHITEYVRGQVLHSMVNHIAVPDQTTITMVVDENGLAAKLPVNTRASVLYDGPTPIWGNAVVVGLHKDMIEGWEPVDLRDVMVHPDALEGEPDGDDLVARVKHFIDYRLSRMGQR